MSDSSKTLHPHKSTSSKLKTSLLLVVSVLFVAVGIWMFPEKALKGSFIAGFFGLCTIVFLIQLLPGSSWLSMDEEGFTYCTLFKKHRVRWQDVQGFSVVHIGVNNMVGWSYVDGFKESAGGRKLSRALTGVGAALPDTYGKSASDLAELMNSFIPRTL